MVKLDDYDDDSVAACKSVLVEAFTVLGRHRGHLVLVGGWVPPLLMPGAGHIGSMLRKLSMPSAEITNLPVATLSSGQRHYWVHSE